MCGVFGYIKTGERSINIDILRKAAIAAADRGPHAFGWAWIDSGGELRMYKQPGDIRDHLGLLDALKGARMVIGHTRWATAGSPEENINNHPHHVNGGFFIHNGIVTNYYHLKNEYDLHPISQCDSEIIGQLAETRKGTRWERMLKACRLSAGPMVVMAIWPHPDTMYVVRRGNPLHFSSSVSGLYMCSYGEPLPPKAWHMKSMVAYKISRLKAADGRMKVVQRVLGPVPIPRERPLTMKVLKSSDTDDDWFEEIMNVGEGGAATSTPKKVVLPPITPKNFGPSSDDDEEPDLGDSDEIDPSE